MCFDARLCSDKESKKKTTCGRSVAIYGPTNMIRVEQSDLIVLHHMRTMHADTMKCVYSSERESEEQQSRGLFLLEHRCSAKTDGHRAHECASPCFPPPASWPSPKKKNNPTLDKCDAIRRSVSPGNAYVTYTLFKQSTARVRLDRRDRQEDVAGISREGTFIRVNYDFNHIYTLTVD